MSGLLSNVGFEIRREDQPINGPVDWPGEVIRSVCMLSEPAVPSSMAQALAMVRAGLGYLSSCDAAELGTPVQAEALIGLEQAEAQHTAARARLLAAFSAQQGHHADGQYGPAAWLRAVTHVTPGAAGAAVKWARRLAAHPLIAAALAAGQLSSSWAKMICQWTDRLPEERRADADAILLAAAGGGAGLADLGALAQQMIERSRTTPDRGGDRFGDRAVGMETTIGGAGRLSGDLTGPAAAAVAAVLAALGASGGPEDTRSLLQRQHDALEEACQRLIRSWDFAVFAQVMPLDFMSATEQRIRRCPGAPHPAKAHRPAVRHAYVDPVLRGPTCAELADRRLGGLPSHPACLREAISTYLRSGSSVPALKGVNT